MVAPIQNPIKSLSQGTLDQTSHNEIISYYIPFRAWTSGWTGARRIPRTSGSATSGHSNFCSVRYQCEAVEGLLSAWPPNPPSAEVLQSTALTPSGGPVALSLAPSRHPTQTARPWGGGGVRATGCAAVVAGCKTHISPIAGPAASVATRPTPPAVPARAGSDAAPALTPFILRVLLRCRRRRYARPFFQRPPAPLFPAPFLDRVRAWARAPHTVAHHGDVSVQGVCQPVWQEGDADPDGGAGRYALCLRWPLGRDVLFLVFFIEEGVGGGRKRLCGVGGRCFVSSFECGSG